MVFVTPSMQACEGRGGWVHCLAICAESVDGFRRPLAWQLLLPDW